MLRRFYTVMVVPHDGGGLKRLRVSANFLMSMASIFLFCFVSSAFLSHFFLDGMHRLDEADRLRAQLAASRVEMGHLRADFERTVVKVEALTERLEKQAASKGDSDQSSYVGGVELFEGEEGSEALVMDGDWRATARAAWDKADYWLQRLDEQMCAEDEQRRCTPASWPLDVFIRTSGFGMRRDPINGRREFHPGLDLAAPHGTPVMATADGVVVEARRNGGYGNMIRVDHGNGFETVYGHLRKMDVKLGDAVTRGEIIGYVGSTGRSTGPHLHYEVIENGTLVDPVARFFKGRARPEAPPAVKRSALGG